MERFNNTKRRPRPTGGGGGDWGGDDGGSDNGSCDSGGGDC